MATFYWSGGNKDGAVFKGEIEAENNQVAALKVRRQGLYVLTLRKSTQFGPFDLEGLGERIFGAFSGELSPIERILFTTHLASMLKTGVSMIEAIGTFDDESSNPRTRRMFKRIISDLESGRPLSFTLARFPKTFSPIYTHIISSGESMGTLGETLEYLGNQLKRDYDLISKVRGAMIYPIVIMTVMIAVFVFITLAVVPKLLTFAQNVGKELPLSTKILIAITNVMINYGVIILVLLIVAAVGLIRILGTERGKSAFDGMSLRLPLIGPLVRKFNLARFSRLLGSFYHYGIPVPTAFAILATSLPNYHYSMAVNRMRERLAHGTSLSAAIDAEKSGFFPKLLVRVMRTAEKSAEVDTALIRIAEYYEGELDNTLKNLTTIIEPILILILGAAVLGLAVAVVVPIYQITTSFK